MNDKSNPSNPKNNPNSNDNYDTIEVDGRILRVHHPDQCSGSYCCIHNPSPHKLADAPLHRRDDRVLERVCKHGIGHPDPDSIEHIRMTMGWHEAWGESVHGCDGCCG